MEVLWRRASQVVSFPGEGPCAGAALAAPVLIENGALLVRNGHIAAVGATRDLDRMASPQCEVIDAQGSVIVPGFVDAHTHPVFAGTREDEYEQRILGKTYQDIAAGGGGIRRSVRLTRAADEELLYALARTRAGKFLRHGTTTIEGKSGYGLSLDDELRLLRVLRRMDRDTPLEVVPTFLGAHEIPDEFRDRPDAYLAEVVDRMLPAVAAEKLAEYCDVFCEPHVFALPASRRCLAAAKELGFGLRVHADQLTRSGGARLAADLGAVTADHLEQATEEDFIALKEAGVFPVLLPGSVFHLGLKNYPDARRMIDLGLPIVLASDFNPGSSPTLNMPFVMSLACTQMRMTPAEALAACTVNAAHSLGRGDRIGSLEPGKQADFVLFDAEDYRQIPYFFAVDLIRTVVKRGTIVYAGIPSA